MHDLFKFTVILYLILALVSTSQADSDALNFSEKTRTPIGGSALIPVEAFEDMGGWFQTARLDYGAVYRINSMFVSPVQFSNSIGDLPNSVPTLDDLSNVVGEMLPQTFTIVPSNTQSLTLMTDTGEAFAGINLNGVPNSYPQLIGFGSFNEAIPTLSNNSIFVEADKLYMIRWRLESPYGIEDSTKLPLCQLIVGENGAYGLGRSLLSFDGNSMNNLAGGFFEFRQYFYAHDSGDIGFFVNLYDEATDSPNRSAYPDGHLGHSIKIHRIDVFEVDPEKLTNEQVIFNQGQASVPVDVNEPSPSPLNYEGEFDLDVWSGIDYFQAIADETNTSRNPVHLPITPFVALGESYNATGQTAERLSYSFQGGLGPTFISWNTLKTRGIDDDSDDPVYSEVRELLEVDEGTLVVMDFWLSAFGTPAQLPFVRVGMRSDNVLPGGGLPEPGAPIQGYVAYHEFFSSSQPFPRADGTLAYSPTNLINGATKRVRLVWEAQLTSTSLDTGRYAFGPEIQTFEIPINLEILGGGPNATQRATIANGAIITHRVVVTTYDQPAGALTETIPAGLTDI